MKDELEKAAKAAAEYATKVFEDAKRVAMSDTKTKAMEGAAALDAATRAFEALKRSPSLD